MSRKLILRLVLALLAILLLAVSWWGWSCSGMSLLQLDMFVC